MLLASFATPLAVAIIASSPTPQAHVSLCQVALREVAQNGGGNAKPVVERLIKEVGMDEEQSKVQMGICSVYFLGVHDLGVLMSPKI